MDEDWRSTKPTTAYLLDLFEEKMRERGEKPTPLSSRIAGHSKVFANMRTGNSPGAETLKAVCDALDLEFYVGPPRHNVPSGETPNPAILGPADVRDAHTDTTPAGRVWLEVVIGPLGTAQMMLTPEEAKALSASLAHRALEIEEKR